MIRFYFRPKIIKNINDNHDWVIIKNKKTALICDSIKPLFLYLWISKIPTPIMEPIGCWILKDNK